MKNIYIAFKKCLAVILTAILMLSQPASRALAEELTPEPTPTQMQITQDAQISNTSDATANTGDNTITEPTPAPEESTESTPQETPSPTPTPTEEETLPLPEEQTETLASSSADITNDVISDTNTGENAIEPGPDEEQQTPSQSAQIPAEESETQATDAAAISTGDAVSAAAIDNTVNTTTINSQVFYQTINLFFDATTNLDLSNPQALITEIVEQNENQEVINVAISQTATVNNEVKTQANTGGNEIQTEEGGSITTGDAYSLISLFNRINFVMVDSVLHIVTLNIFGNFSGNILLPDAPASTPNDCPTCGQSTQVTSSAAVENSINSSADTGNNGIAASDEAGNTIETGHATSTVHLVNFVNTALIGTHVFYLFLTPYGTWNGQFRGWGDLGPSSGGGPLAITHHPQGQPNNEGCPTCIEDLSVSQNASLTNTVSSEASTGENNISGTSGQIRTGQATSVVSLVNFINTTMRRSFGFFAFINIFGNWQGDIGEASAFTQPPAQEPPDQEVQAQQTTQTNSSIERETGGQLGITLTNNVGTHVLPGDTVTFFITAKNIGSGKVYDTVVNLSLVRDGINRGGATFNIGPIEPGKGVKITTGLVLSEETPGGQYTAVATIRGHIGPENQTVSASASNLFTVFNPAITSFPPEVPSLSDVSPQVLGSTQQAATDSFAMLRALLVLLLLIPTYATYRAIQERQRLGLLFQRNMSFRVRLRTLHTILI